MEIKKIVGGKMYNTQTAKELGYYWNAKSLDDCDYFYQGLYRKKNGELFLLTQTWNNVKVAPNLTEDQAENWAEKNLDTETYVNIFGNPEE